MKIQNITNIEKFFEVVDSCNGRRRQTEFEIKAFPVRFHGKAFF